MSRTKSTDILLNIVLPLLVGMLLYLLQDYTVFPSIVRNYAADGLWAYAFLSCLLIIWNRSVNIFWISAAFFLAVTYEILQYYQIAAGTADIFDVVTYILFFILALTLNTTSKKIYIFRL